MSPPAGSDSMKEDESQETTTFEWSAVQTVKFVLSQHQGNEGLRIITVGTENSGEKCGRNDPCSAKTSIRNYEYLM